MNVEEYAKERLTESGYAAYKEVAARHIDGVLANHSGIAVAEALEFMSEVLLAVEMERLGITEEDLVGEP